MPADEPLIRVEVRHAGRLYVAEVAPNGGTSVLRDGAWLCNGDWNGRALDCGLAELSHDQDRALEIGDVLSNAIEAAFDAQPERRVIRRKGR